MIKREKEESGREDKAGGKATGAGENGAGEGCNADVEHSGSELLVWGFETFHSV